MALIAGARVARTAFRAFSSSARRVTVVAHEYGHTGRPLPTFACDGPGNITFADGGGGDGGGPAAKEVTLRDIPDVPGGFILENVLTDEECAQFVAATESMGYDEDAPVSLPHSFRHMENVNWLVDETIPATIFDRVAGVLPAEAQEVAPGAEALGINARFRCYKYGGGDYFQFHTDGSWPGSLAVARSDDGARELVWDAWGGGGVAWSQLTFLLLLSDGYEGGRTLFETAEGDVVAVRTPKGGALCFPHGGHPQHVRHAGETVESGLKYMIRTELLYRRTPESDAFQHGWFRDGSGQG